MPADPLDYILTSKKVIPSSTVARFEQPPLVSADRSASIARDSDPEFANSITPTRRGQSIGLTRSPAICYSSVRTLNVAAGAEGRPRRASVSAFITTPHQDRRATYHSSNASAPTLQSPSSAHNPRHSVLALSCVGSNPGSNIRNQCAQPSFIDFSAWEDPREQPVSGLDDPQPNKKHQSWTSRSHPRELHVTTHFDRRSPSAASQRGLTHEVRILITQDFDLCYILHLPKMMPPAAIVDKIYNKLNIPQREQVDWSIFRVSGSEPVGPALDSQSMWEQCEAAANHHTLFMYLVLPCDPQIICGQLGRFLDQPELSLAESKESWQSSLAPRYAQLLSVSPSDQSEQYDQKDELSSASQAPCSWSLNIQSQHVTDLLPSSSMNLQRKVSFKPNLDPIVQGHQPSPVLDGDSGCETPEEDGDEHTTWSSQGSPWLFSCSSHSSVPPQLIDDSATECSTADYSALLSPRATAPVSTYGFHSSDDLVGGRSPDGSSALRASIIATQAQMASAIQAETNLNARQHGLVCADQQRFFNKQISWGGKSPIEARNPAAEFESAKQEGCSNGGTAAITEEKNIVSSENPVSSPSSSLVNNRCSSPVDNSGSVVLRENLSLQVSPEVSWLGSLMEDSFQSAIVHWSLMGELGKLDAVEEEIIQSDGNSDLEAVSLIETSNPKATDLPNPSTKQSQSPRFDSEPSAGHASYASSEVNCDGVALRFDDVESESNSHSVSSTFQVPMEMCPPWNAKARNEEFPSGQVGIANAHPWPEGSKINEQIEADPCPSYVPCHKTDPDHPMEVRFDLSEQNVSENNELSEISPSNSGWASRPAIEKVYENLEKSFPNHDVDEPIEISVPNVPPFSRNKKMSGNTRAFSVVNRVLSIRSSVKERICRAGETKCNQPKPSRGENYGDMNVTRNTSPHMPPANGLKLWGFRTEEVLPGRKSDVHSNPPNHSLASNGSSSSLKWVKGELIGSGSFGKVYLALNLANHGMMAVKQVKAGSQVPPNQPARSALGVLKAEVCFLKGLEHPNIVQYLGCEETPNKCDIFLEYVPGGSIGSCIAKYGRLESNVAKSFTLQILQGLAYLHDSCILHRDLKTDNILVDFDGRCKISDFGLSKRSHEPYTTHLNTSMQGTVFTMAPEVFTRLDQCRYSAKADIWSLGCVVLEMLGGSRAWAGLNEVQIIYKVCFKGHTPLIPEEIQADKYSHHFVKKCLEIAPVSRPTANRLIYHRFVQLDPTWAFQKSRLYHSVNNLGEAPSGESDS